MNQADALADLAEEYFRVLMDASPFDATMFGVPGWDAAVPDLSEDGDAGTDRRLAGLERRLGAVDPAGLGPQDRITLAMLGRGLADRRAELAARWPELTVSAAAGGIQTAVLGLVPKVTLATPEQAAAYLERCARLAGCLDQAGDRLRAGSRERIAAGTPVTVEPGVYLPGFGGVRIEDLVVARHSGHEVLTTTPKELLEL